VLLECLLAPRATASAPGQCEQPANINGFAQSAKWQELKNNEQHVSEKNVQHQNLV
jgi:hypothetical protein